MRYRSYSVCCYSLSRWAMFCLRLIFSYSSILILVWSLCTSSMYFYFNTYRSALSLSILPPNIWSIYRNSQFWQHPTSASIRFILSWMLPTRLITLGCFCWRGCARREGLSCLGSEFLAAVKENRCIDIIIYYLLDLFVLFIQ